MTTSGQPTIHLVNPLSNLKLVQFPAQSSSQMILSLHIMWFLPGNELVAVYYNGFEMHGIILSFCLVSLSTSVSCDRS